MARYRGPVCKLCRLERQKLFLKGERCYSPKCAMERRDYPPGEHGQLARFRRRRPSDYYLQLREKQKVRNVYGVLERQFRRYFRMAERMPGLTGENLLILLERRLDNVVYRLGFADSRAQARQLVQHGHFVVNNRRTTIPSYLIREGDIIAVREGSQKRTYFKNRAEMLDAQHPPHWLSLDPGTLSARVVGKPRREDVDIPFEEGLVVGYYSR
ncbi:MAG: 30S ribosomal protein S4 [Anaerolineae bacterium]|nr:30S ribosomal protein S4 [Anaerolineae bacterium]